MWIKYRIERLWFRFKWACQRFYRGYDDCSVWNIDSHIRKELICLLTDYKKTNCCVWVFPDTLKEMTEQEMNGVLDMIIYHLEMMDEDFVEKTLYGSCVEDDDYVVGGRTQEEYERIREVQLQNKDLALDLLKEFWYQLWD